ncbi:MAG: transcriptional repressor [Phycisphaerae bacterium]
MGLGLTPQALYTVRMDAAEQLLRDFLRSRRLKATRERLAILRATAGFGRPFEAEELLLKLREDERAATGGSRGRTPGRKVMGNTGMGRGAGGVGGGSKATVYRTLKHLVEAGLLKQIHFGAGKQAHYDYVAAGQASHDHLLDLDTGKVMPFSNAEIVQLRDRIARELGFTAVGHRFQIMARRIEGK